ncbi:GTP-binding protein [Candidatus Woesebacteria bacterium]|nr:GTP-binding protein [Candidatus Woesebacteria bacterium]
MKNKIPTTVFSGFLGSGKTTIISNLIDTLQKQGEQVIYIKNEIGDTDIDSKILEGKGIKTKELLNGCICCTLVGPFISSITEVVETFNPDRIIIEASGAADPSALALMISSHPLLERDGVIVIIDVLNFEGYKDLTVTAQNQTKFTDLLVFNKVELADLQQKKAVVGYVRELNTHSPIVEAPHGIVNPNVIFGLNTNELEKLLSEKHETHTDHIHEDEIQAFTLQLSHTTTLEKLESFLKTLPKNIFRAKGFVTVADQVFIFNTVGSRTTFIQAPEKFEKQQQGMLVFIGYHANETETEVAQNMEKLLN